MGGSSPLLSICIPTFNRADLLRSALWALVPQVKEAGDLVQVIVSDNCSSDHTEAVVHWAQQYIPIRYNRNSENLGSTGNYLMFVNSLAEGDFCWILGDDDLVRETAVKRVLDTIQSHPEIDYFFVNHSYEQLSERKKHGTLVTGSEFPELRSLLCYELNDHIVRRWEEIIKLSRVPALFTSIVSHVMRLSVWREGAAALKVTGRGTFDTLEDTFPHTCIVARMMVGKPAYYVGYPCVILFTGTQEWFENYWPMILFVHVLRLADLFESLGVERRLADHYRKMVFQNSFMQFLDLVTRPSMRGRESFSLTRLLYRYWRYLEFWKMLARTVKYKMFSRV